MSTVVPPMQPPRPPQPPQPPQPSSTIRTQKKGQNARQAMVISGLNTIYRTNAYTHGIQKQQRTEPRIYFLDITLDEINKQYSRIHQLIERGRLRPKGTETFFVSKKMEHLILTDASIYEIRVSDKNREQYLQERIPVDGRTTTTEIVINNPDCQNKSIPVLVDESYYELKDATNSSRCILPPNHIVVRTVKKIVKTHPKSMTAFVFLFNESESEVVDFYITTENGIVSSKGVGYECITITCRSDIISFIDQFRLCS
jgi:hypothetical protein